MARVKGGLSNLMPLITESQEAQVSAGEGTADARLSVVGGPASTEPTTVTTAPAAADQAPAAATLDASPEKSPAAVDKPRKRSASARPARKKVVAPPQPEPEDADLPRYLQLERKDVRMRADQLDSLTNLSRRLNKVRRSRGERITENTLVRVAIDLLLENEAALAGFTEDELRSSAGLGA